LLHVSVTINHNWAYISVHGHAMFSATVWDPILFTLAVYNSRHYDIEQFIIIMSEILYGKCTQYGIPYCGTKHVHVLKCLPDDG